MLYAGIVGVLTQAYIYLFRTLDVVTNTPFYFDLTYRLPTPRGSNGTDVPRRYRYFPRPRVIQRPMASVSESVRIPDPCYRISLGIMNKMNMVVGWA